MVVKDDGELAHLEPAYRRYATLPDEERIAWIRADRWVAFEQAEAALSRLSDLLTYPPRDRMPCLLIYGDTGMGKTKIIRKFERQNPKRLCQPTGVTKRPVVVALTPPEPIERELYAEILIALDAPVLTGGSTAREKDICRRLLRTVEARMLVLDQANDMLVGTFRQQRVFLNAIRFLANDLRIPLVCVGTDQARQALLTDAQLAERFEALHLEPWRHDRALAMLLNSLGAILPLRRPSELNDGRVRERVLELSDGVTARIFRLIELVAEDAIRLGEERIGLASFESDRLALPLVSMTHAVERRQGRVPTSRLDRR